MPIQSKWLIQDSPKSHCKICDNPVTLLCHETKDTPMFYICWVCRDVAEVGRGPVKDIAKEKMVARKHD